MRCSGNAFLSHSIAVSFPMKFISIGISNSASTSLFIILPVTFQLAYDSGKRRNLLKVRLRKRGTCPRTSSRLKRSIAIIAPAYSSYPSLSSLLQYKESSPI